MNSNDSGGVAGATGERMATSVASFYRPYRSKPSGDPRVLTWVQIDLGSSQVIDAVKLYPYTKPHAPAGDGFPVRFRIECSDDAEFGVKQSIVDHSGTDYPDPEDRIVQFQASHKARYVRLTALCLRAKKLHLLVEAFLPEASRKSYRDWTQSMHVLSLSKIEVLSRGVDIARRQPVSVDEAYGNLGDAPQLTRPPRPQGENLVTDNPQNVTSPELWQPVACRARAPLGEVRLHGGLFTTALQNNVRYLLDSFTVDDLLRPFRERAGKPAPSSTRKLHALWEEALPGSNAGRFLMGAGTTLRWLDDGELSHRLNAVVEGIVQCRQDNGHIMAYPEDTFFISERGAYDRAWVTHGLIEAGYAGNAKAFELLRGYYDWYNRQDFLPLALRGCSFGPQGTVANTRLYFTPVGTPTDLHIVQRYLQENYWLEDLAARKVDAIWQYPYDRPHCYLVTFLEPYLDLYRATGERRYLDAALGGWELFRDNWQAIGGSILMQEWEICPPQANPLYERCRGETCGSAFWVLLNQRLHLLDPEAEKYVAEIEKSLYNIFLANQSGGEGIRYFTRLVGKKDQARCVNSCCEGQGTRILGSLPEYIYSIADDGLYVNLFERSSIGWRQGDNALQVTMETDFPNAPHVWLNIHAAQAVQAKIRVRTPSWAAGAMEIQVNGESTAIGTPGSYVTLDRLWSQGDAISFVLPVALKLIRYEGVDRAPGRERFALEYGPILMAALDSAETQLVFQDCSSPWELTERLERKADRPLHFVSPLDFSQTVWVPYFEIDAESFSCVPIIECRLQVL